jgi:hypothetical protein
MNISKYGLIATAVLMILAFVAGMVVSGQYSPSARARATRVLWTATPEPTPNPTVLHAQTQTQRVGWLAAAGVVGALGLAIMVAALAFAAQRARLAAQIPPFQELPDRAVMLPGDRAYDPRLGALDLLDEPTPADPERAMALAEHYARRIAAISQIVAAIPNGGPTRAQQRALEHYSAPVAASTNLLESNRSRE